jgi:hypothetical protein
MADMCETELRVYGKRQNLDKFIIDIDSSNEDQVIDFNKIIPMPNDLSKWDKDKDGSGLLNWRCENWGVGRDACLSKLTDNGDHLYYFFCTAWDPPFPIYEALISSYQTLDFDIIAIEKYLFQCVDISSKQGKIIKYITWSDKWVRYVNGESKFHLLKTDWVNGILHVGDPNPEFVD